MDSFSVSHLRLLHFSTDCRNWQHHTNIMYVCTWIHCIFLECMERCLTSYYRNGANSSPTAGAEVSLILGIHIKQDEHISCYKDQSVFIQQLQVPPSSTVITIGVAECRIQKGPILQKIYKNNTISARLKCAQLCGFCHY